MGRDLADVARERGRGAVAALVDDARAWQPEPEPAPQEGRRLDLAAWGASRFAGDPPEPSWLIEDVVPLGVPMLLASIGGVGKSYVLLDLAVRIALGSSRQSPVLGGKVAASGAAVVVTAEDDQAEVHRRLAALDPNGRRFRAGGDRLAVVPLPDAGGILPLFVEERGRYVATDEWRTLADQLAGIEDLKLVVLDPLQGFAPLPINEDPAAGQFVCAHLAQLAATTGATVIVSHHMRKGATPPADLDEARERIRGSSALVDGVRLAFALWPSDDKTMRCTARALNQLPETGACALGGVVKANGRARRDLRTYWRDPSGVLADVTMRAGEVEAHDDLVAGLVSAVGEAAAAGQPFCKTGQNGVFEQKHRLPPPLRDLPKRRLWGLVETALERGTVVACVGPGSTTARFLDVPSGRFAEGSAEVKRGAAS